MLTFRTNVDDWVAAGAGHALRFEPEATGGLSRICMSGATCGRR